VDVLLEGERVQALVPREEATPGVPTEPVEGYLAPGLVDIHQHGYGGRSYADPQAEDLEEVRAGLFAHGVRAFLASLPSLPPVKVREQLARLAPQVGREEPGRAVLLGVHLEGPYLSPAHRGAHPRELLRLPSWEEVAEWLDAFPGVVRMVTLAPELPGALEVARQLRRRGVVAAMGHTDADADTAFLALAAGMHHVTHLWNGMGPLHHRRPGPVGAVLSFAGATAELIADGHHVRPEVLALSVAVLGPYRCVLVTDAMQAAGLGDGDYQLGEMPVEVRQGVARTPEGNLAGSTLTLERAVENVVSWGVASLPQAVGMATWVPARVLGTGPWGSWEKGAPAPVALGPRGELFDARP
jgi:N-acetylglucosamine-6-phosphate deacetylase